jgi:hypothetical protein
MSRENRSRAKWLSVAQPALSPGLTCLRTGRMILISASLNCNLVTHNLVHISFNRDVYIHTVVLDGNFSASHLKQGKAEDDVWLTEGEGMMAERTRYKAHIDIAIEIKEVSNTQICHRLSVTYELAASYLYRSQSDSI